MKKNETEAFFEKYREHLKYEIVRFISYFKLYRTLHERREDRINEINISKAFFQIIMDSLYSSIIIWTDKLLSKKSDRSLLHFLSFIENNRKIFDISELKRRRGYADDHWMLDREPITFQTIKQDRQLILNLDSLQSIKLRRDKFHAHFDKKYFFSREKFGEDAPLKWSDFDTIFDLMKGVLNKYSASYDGTTYRLTPLNVTDVNRALDILHEYRTGEIEQYFNDRYAYGKLSEFVQLIFVDIDQARKKLIETLGEHGHKK
jgi:hypothetical protein